MTRRALPARSLCRWLLLAAGIASAAAAADSPPGLMIHVPLDGSVADVRALGAVRGEAEGRPVFMAGAAGAAGTPEAGRRHVGTLHVSRLSWLMLRGRTPATGTIMLWVRLEPAPAAADTAPAATAPAASEVDTTMVHVLSSDAPLNLEVAVGGRPRQVRAAFDDRAGTRRRAAAPIPDDGSWMHVALGWDAPAGTVVVFVAGRPSTTETASAFEMPGLPKVFGLGAPGAAIDDFRLYNRLLEGSELMTLPGLTATSW